MAQRWCDWGLQETAKNREVDSDGQDSARAQTRLSVSAHSLPVLGAARLAAVLDFAMWLWLYLSLGRNGDGACDPTKFLHGIS